MQGDYLLQKQRYTSENKDADTKRKERTGVLAALFLFQYSLLIPLMRFINPSILIAVSGVLLLVATFIVNRSIVINIKSSAVLLLLLLVMLLKTLIDDTEPKVIVQFVLIGAPPIFFFAYRFDTEKFLNTCYILAYMNFAVLATLPFWGRNPSYMRFGNGMVLTSVFLYLLVFRSNRYTDINTLSKRKKFSKIIAIIVFVISALETTIYGNRGALLLLLVFIAFDALLVYRNHIGRNILIIATGFLAVMNLEHILGLLIAISSRFGVFSYALKKYQYQLIVGIEGGSSGRIRLYQNALSEIRARPFLGNKMILYDDKVSYVHNLFLQVGRDMGVLFMIVLIVFVFYCIYLLFTNKVSLNRKTIIAVFFCVSVVRLMLSSNIWERPEFWAFVGIVLNYKFLLCDPDRADAGPG